MHLNKHNNWQYEEKEWRLWKISKGLEKKQIRHRRDLLEVHFRYRVPTTVDTKTHTKLILFFSVFSSVHYLKLFGIWLVLILLDYLLHFRFEYVWPFWLLFHKIVEGIKHQGFVSTYTYLQMMYRLFCYLCYFVNCSTLVKQYQIF